MSGVSRNTASGFILHSYPYRETSLIVETFTREHGRVAMLAKGAKRPRGALRGTLNSFQPLWLEWLGKSDLKTLTRAEQQRIYPQLAGVALFSAFYLNELLLKLFHHDDPHQIIFDAYQVAIESLLEASARFSGNATINQYRRAVATALRQFEMVLLTELGYALMLTKEAGTETAILPAARYVYVLERGPVCIQGEGVAQEHGLQLHGRTLLDMAVGNYENISTQQQAKQLMRFVINHLLGNQVLHTRNLIQELRNL